jgi:hypothetical protein
MRPDTQRLGNLARQGIGWCRAPAGLLALAGLLLAGAVHLAAINGVDVETLWPRVWLLHAGLFPLVALAVVFAAAGAPHTRPPGTRIGLRELLTLVPLLWRLLLGAALAYAVITFFVYAPLSGAGDPIVKDGSFFFDNHGVIREVSEAQFHAQRSSSLRLYSAFWLYLYLFAAVLLLGSAQARLGGR